MVALYGASDVWQADGVASCTLLRADSDCGRHRYGSHGLWHGEARYGRRNWRRDEASARGSSAMGLDGD